MNLVKNCVSFRRNKVATQMGLEGSKSRKHDLYILRSVIPDKSKIKKFFFCSKQT